MDVILLEQEEKRKLGRGDVVSYMGNICVVIERPSTFNTEKKVLDLMPLDDKIKECYCIDCELEYEETLRHIDFIGNVKNFKFEQIK